MAPEFSSFVRRVGSRIASAHQQREVEEEILDHLEEAALDLEARGMSPDEARRAAMVRFGDPDQIGKELARVHSRIPFRFFATGGLAWFALGAVLFEFHAFWISGHWLLQLPFQILGLPHWLALQSPQIGKVSMVFDPLAQFMSRTLSISPWHLDAAIGALVLTPAAYVVYRLVRAVRRPEVRQAWMLLKAAFKR